MSYTIARRAPITLILDGKPLALPRVRRPFWRQWASELDAAAFDRATEGLDAEGKARWRAVYRILPTTTEDLTRLIATPEGSDRIIGHCLREAGVPADQVDDVLDAVREDERTGLALALASIVDPVNAAAQGGTGGDGGEQGGEAADPLASSGAAASTP